MKHLLNARSVTSEDVCLSLDGENVVAHRNKQEAAHYPLRILSGIASFFYADTSPALMGACIQRDVFLASCTLPAAVFWPESWGKALETYFCAARSAGRQ